MKKIRSTFYALLLTLCLVGCTATNSGTASSSTAADNSTKSSTVTSASTVSSKPAAKKILVAYFSLGENTGLKGRADASTTASIQLLNGKITGNTGIIANMIKDETNGKTYSILTKEKYPADYDTTLTKAQDENHDKKRPKLASHIEDLKDYDTIFLGYPIWWYDMPMAIYSFLDEYDLSGKTIIPFCTSGGSGFLGTIDTIKKAEPDATVLSGLSVGDTSVSGAKEQVTKWLKSINLTH